MIPRAILEKDMHLWVFQTLNSYFEFFKKLTRAYYLQIVLEIMQLPIRISGGNNNKTLSYI